MLTPEHVMPEWYLLPFYAILRSVTFDIGPISSKVVGLALAVAGLVVMFVGPWLNWKTLASMGRRPLVAIASVVFMLALLGLVVCGANVPEDLAWRFGPDRLELTYTDASGVARTESYADFDAARERRGALPPEASPVLSVKSPGVTWQTLTQALVTYVFLFWLLILPLLGKLTPKPSPDLGAQG